MAFVMDYSEVKEGGLIAPGEYEVVITKAEEAVSKKGKENISLTLVVRNDVNQKYQNKNIFHSLWKRIEPTASDQQVQGYSFKQIMALAKAVEIPSGKSYETVADMLKEMINKPVRVTMANEENDGKMYERVKYVNKTNVPECKHVFKDKSNSPAQQLANKAGDLGDFEEILSDGDVPF